MKTKLLALFAIIALAATAFAAEKSDEKNCGCSCCEGRAVCCCHGTDAAAQDSAPPAKESTDPAVARHPLRGVIVAVRIDDSALLVKHEEIPGYMRAMTMLFKVDRATLQAAKKGARITGTLVQRDDGFWLEDMKLLSE